MFLSKKVVSLNISSISYKEALTEIISMGSRNKCAYVCFANAHMVVEAYRSSKLVEQINKATLVLSDGVPIRKALRFLYHHKQDRIAGMDIFPDLLQAAELNNLRVLFFGATPEILEKIEIRAIREFPKLKIAGLLSPPFDKNLNDKSYIEAINNAQPHLVFVALGCPKQEDWMSNHFHKVSAPLLGVGGAFPVYAGIHKRAPIFMQNWGIEWMYRLMQEPRRLFKRYLTTNSLFIYLILKDKLRLAFANLK